MPDRRHLWRGIHDPAMVKAGVQISLRTDRSRYRPGESLHATLTIANSGVGHYFPTYVTPRVLVRTELLDAESRPLADSVEEHSIAREVPLDLSREVSDTRIPPGRRAVFEYRRRVEGPGLSLRVTVTVFPDHFYTGFFEALLSGDAGTESAEIQEALSASRRSAFVLYSRTVPLTAGPPRPG
jgi:hypothetical protein